MTLDDTIKMTMRHVRNWFNDNNSESEAHNPPSDFLALCGEIQAFIENPANSVSAYTSETVTGLHSWSRGVGKNGAPLTWQDLFANRLSAFRLHMYSR